jgi:hypothetical protein
MSLCRLVVIRTCSGGVVPYSSSHLEGAESEKIVLAGHVVFSNEAAVLEIKRILEENLAIFQRQAPQRRPQRR